jgi:hypothetical protein
MIGRVECSFFDCAVEGFLRSAGRHSPNIESGLVDRRINWIRQSANPSICP